MTVMVVGVLVWYVLLTIKGVISLPLEEEEFLYLLRKSAWRQIGTSKILATTRFAHVDLL